MVRWEPRAGEVVWADTFNLGLMRARVERISGERDAPVFLVKDVYGPDRLEVSVAALSPITR